MRHSLYCLDANVLIVPWQTYYAPEFCPSYWDVLDQLGQEKRLFIPGEVFTELEKTEDDLLDWVKKSHVPIVKTDTEVLNCLRAMYAANPVHKLLSDATSYRSMADPFVVAHAMKANACVVTKETKIEASMKKIKIPNVCENMGVPWINDFQLGRHFDIKLACSR